jgi:hypothetical protein
MTTGDLTMLTLLTLTNHRKKMLLLTLLSFAALC